MNHPNDVPVSLKLLATEMWFVIPPPPRANLVSLGDVGLLSDRLDR